jgi:hypothetical protein
MEHLPATVIGRISQQLLSWALRKSKRLSLSAFRRLLDPEVAQTQHEMYMDLRRDSIRMRAISVSIFHTDSMDSSTSVHASRVADQRKQKTLSATTFQYSLYKTRSASLI